MEFYSSYPLFMKICHLLNEKNILTGLVLREKDDVINKLIDSLSDQIDADILRNIRTAVFEREAIMSTGVGKGLAIPHGKCKGLKKTFAAFALLKEPIDYDAIDGNPVSMVFLLVGPESQNSTHIKMLSRISRLMNNNEFRQQLLDSQSPDDVQRLFEHEEEQYMEI